MHKTRNCLNHPVDRLYPEFDFQNEILSFVNCRVAALVNCSLNLSLSFSTRLAKSTRPCLADYKNCWTSTVKIPFPFYKQLPSSLQEAGGASRYLAS